MKTTAEHNQRVTKLTFASVYPHYVAKVEKKGRSVEELHQVIAWLTGYTAQDIQSCIDQNLSFEAFFIRPHSIHMRTLSRV